MKNIFKVLIIAILAAGCSSAKPPVRISFNTDFGGDADDLGALAMLHNLADQGECEQAAIMCWSTEKSAIPAIYAVKRWYAHLAIPLGLRTEGSHVAQWNYNRVIAQNFKNRPVKELLESKRESSHSYFKLTMTADELSSLIEAIMLNEI